MRQTTEYLHVSDPSPEAFGVSVELRQIILETTNCLKPGMALIKPLMSSPCGSDTDRNGGYYRNRFYRDITDNHPVPKLPYNLAEMRGRQGYTSPDTVLTDFLHGPFHEAVAAVRAFKPKDTVQLPTYAAAFLPDIRGGKISGVHYAAIAIEPEFKPGDLVIPHAAWRCQKHRQIDDTKPFPDDCHRKPEPYHKYKRVPGHFEYPPYGHESEDGLPYHASMLTKIPPDTTDWIMANPKKRLVVAEQMEPRSCAFQALSPIILAGEKPGNIVILGDGPNAMELALVATTIFPDTHVTIVGRTDRKLQAIRAITPDRIHTVQIEANGKGPTEQQSAEILKRELAGEQADVFIPTVRLENIGNYKPIVRPDGRVIIWVAEQTTVSERKKFLGVVPDDRVFPSYGGWHHAETTATLCTDALVKTAPEKLERAAEYPYQYMSLTEAAAPLEQLINTGKFMVNLDHRPTSGKLIIAHSQGQIF